MKKQGNLDAKMFFELDKKYSFLYINPDMRREIWSNTKNLEFQNYVLLNFKTTQFESSATINS